MSRIAPLIERVCDYHIDKIASRKRLGGKQRVSVGLMVIKQLYSEVLEGRRDEESRPAM